MPSLREPNGGHQHIQSGILVIPLFAENSTHSSVPLAVVRPSRAAAVKGGLKAGARALPLTAASTMASAHRSAGGGFIMTERRRWTS